MSNPLTDRSEPEGEEKRDLVDRVSATLIILVTVVVALMLTVSACRAYGERSQVLSEYKKLTPRLEAMEIRVERRTQDALKRLDPDYERAVYEYERGTLSPGEELLPIYDGNKEG